jgi:hypothetical protein
MNKFTVIYNDHFQRGSHWHSITKIKRLTAPDIKTVMGSSYGQDAVFIFQGWPRMAGEVFENEYPLEITHLS